MSVKDNPNNRFITKEQFVNNRKKEKKIAAELKAYEDELLKDEGPIDAEPTEAEETAEIDGNVDETDEPKKKQVKRK